MNFEAISQLADALLYEGYLLYPYRSTSVKNQQRFTFGCLLPPEFLQPPGSVERAFLHTECLLLGNPRTQIEVVVRFLQLMTQVDRGVPLWPDTAARVIETPAFTMQQLLDEPHEHNFAFEATRQSEGALVRSLQAIGGTITLSAQRCDDNCFKLSVHVENRTPISGECRTREEALAWSLLSCHVLLGVGDGDFLSLLDPPPAWRDAAASCRNVGAYPGLAGDKTRRDTMLAAPIILYDYPQIAAQSPGDLFDGTEMDEMLTLRIRTLTDDEKHAMAALDPRAQRMLDRCETITPEQLANMHGTWRHDDLAPGMRVRLRPQGRADAFDLALAGMTAVIVSIEQAFENRVYVSVAVDDDPGRDLGLAGKPGHRFYFRPEEVEPLDMPSQEHQRMASQERQRLEEDRGAAGSRLLIAGIGNIFFGDDAFGVEVVRLLAARSWPAEVTVRDFGIRGFDLACALQDGYDTVIMVDAVSRGSPPGTLHVLELDPEADASAPPGSQTPVREPDQMHHLDLVQVFNLVRRMGGRLPRLRLVGCEPATLEAAVDLSEAVRYAVAEAVAVIESLIAKWSFTHENT